MMFRILFLSCIAVLLGFTQLHSQSLRSLNNDGVKKYNEKKFADAEVNFKKGLDKVPDNFISNFNLGDAYYQQKRYDEAMSAYQTALAEAKTGTEKSKVYHNIGNSLLKSNQIKESIEAYKNALKLNPNDNDTKYNLSYALSMLKNQQNQQNQKQDNKNQQNKDQNKQNNKDQQQKNKEQQNKQNQQNAQQDATKQKQQQNKISKEEAERILQALRNNEQELQKQLRRQKGTPLKTDKDW